MCQGRASFPRPFSIPGAVLYSALCSVSYLPTQKHYTGQMHTGLVDGHLLHPALPSGPGYLNQNSASLTKSLPARNPQTSCSEPKDAPLHQVCLDVFMEHDADLIRETQYVLGHMRRNCRHALWRVEQLLYKLEKGESLNTSSTATQLAEAREEFFFLIRGRPHRYKLFHYTNY